MLHKLQTDFKEWVLGNNQTIALSPHALSERWAIYRNNYRQALTRSLQDLYPIISMLVGTDCFYALAHKYIHDYPPHSFTLDQYGDQFSEFLTTIVELNHLPYLSEVAELEWVLYSTQLKSEGESLDLQQLGALDAEQQEKLILKLNPSISLLAFVFPVYTIWKAHQTTIPETWSLDLAQGGENVIVWMRNNQIMLESINDEMLRLLKKMERGVYLKRLVEEENSETVTQGLQLFFKRGWLEKET